MTKAIPQIQRYMTTTPVTINYELDLQHARQMMLDHQIRHLPVMNDGKLVGIISEKDIEFIQGFRGVDLKTERVQNAMTTEPVVVEASTHLDVVCDQMAKNKIGSVLVQDNKKLVGIFTWVDALNAMSSLLHSRLS